MMAKPMRKLSTGLSSWGTLMSGSRLGVDVSEDTADVADVVTLVELIQLLRVEVERQRCKLPLSPPHRAENAVLKFTTNSMT